MMLNLASMRVSELRTRVFTIWNLNCLCYKIFDHLRYIVFTTLSLLCMTLIVIVLCGTLVTITF